MATAFGNRGYVWDAEGVIWLRQQCRIVGAMIGNSAEHKQHNCAGGLPCELSLEELQLALQQGWVVLQQTASLPKAAANAADVSETSQHHLRSNAQAPVWLTAVNAKKAVSIPVNKAQQKGDAFEVSGPGSTGLHSISAYSMTSDCADAAGEAPRSLSDTVDKGKHVICSQLHSMGYYITSGAKFGADYLLYPGDPLLFHAQFTVRCLGHHNPIKPALLAGGARGSHAARKHLLLASVNDDAASFITIAPEGGFGAIA